MRSRRRDLRAFVAAGLLAATCVATLGDAGAVWAATGHEGDSGTVHAAAGPAGGGLPANVAGGGASGPPALGKSASVPPTIGATVAPPASEAERVRQELRAILASEEFRLSARRQDAASLLLRAFARAQETIARQPPAVVRGVVLGCLAVLLLIAAHLALSLRAAMRAGRVSASAGGDAPPPTAEEEREAARAAAATGDFAGAIRHLYLAVVRELQRAGFCRVGPGTADWTLVGRCASDPRVGAPLQRLVSTFQELRYGGQPCGPADYEECQSLAAEVMAVVAAEGARAGAPRDGANAAGSRSRRRGVDRGERPKGGGA